MEVETRINLVQILMNSLTTTEMSNSLQKVNIIKSLSEPQFFIICKMGLKHQTLMSQLIHSFIQPMYSEHLLYARHVIRAADTKFKKFSFIFSKTLYQPEDYFLVTMSLKGFCE